MAHNHKYGTVTAERGDIGEQEPVFLVRARDPLARNVLAHYINVRAMAGAPPHILYDLGLVLDEITLWQKENGTKVADA